MADQSAYDRAREGTPFSNNTMWEIWAENNCYRCRNDGIGVGKEQPQCELIAVALCGRTPLEWLTSTAEDEVYGNYRCINFRSRDDPPGWGREPRPRPDPPGQMTLLPREPYEGVRMYADTKPREVHVA
jgi:hypothetical protein